jgi:hypothetical protein
MRKSERGGWLLWSVMPIPGNFLMSMTEDRLMLMLMVESVCVCCVCMVPYLRKEVVCM